MEFDYFIPTKILFGRGKLDQLYKEKMPGKKALIVISAGKSTRANGYLQKVEEQMHKAGVETFVFDKILSNPINGHVMEGAVFAREKKCDFVVGLGGGSSIDSAKAIAVMSTNEGDFWDYISGGSGKGLQVKNDPLPIIAITTTAGTGTEADPWTVITKEETNEKIGFGYEKTFPVLSVVDPELMLTVPADLTAYQGFDALFHSTEGYINNTANVMSDIYSLKAIELISKNLATAVRDGKNIGARECVALGNTLAGMVESTSGCISEHSIEHAMSAFHPNLPHGAGLIMISKAYYSNFVENHACDEKFIEMARVMGKSNASNPMEFVEALVELQEACGVSELKMSDYGITKEELPDIAKNARHTMGGLFEVDPLPVSDETCLEILKQSYR
ncbi:iron-containing alcohol dehydrogenase [Anaerosacchariphilus polymeriproducens]|uniref:Iron-containing alcohol dehydrogenase n=1 Tax=Anaerosacchariphilus polymeriproducens TaxID=1812858 RepID=A0A371AVK7_9FIRM|nr:iron-containing alcohol dehydrogenase [Anaerosacchariphilus polymeriproducens]RDU23618.1 iron-containing alcohol dehydrogenase [Anaerosacchariphilus polymeriproducens]